MPRMGLVQKKMIAGVAYKHDDSPITVDITNLFNGIKWAGGPRTWFLSAVKDSGTGNLDVDINVSHDGGTNKEEVISFTQLSDTGHELKAETIPCNGQKVYAIITISSTAHYTITLTVAGSALGQPSGK